jgi:hypothetical protein
MRESSFEVSSVYSNKKKKAESVPEKVKSPVEVFLFRFIGFNF